MRLRVIPIGVERALDYLASDANPALPALLRLEDAPPTVWSAITSRGS